MLRPQISQMQLSMFGYGFGSGFLLHNVVFHIATIRSSSFIVKHVRDGTKSRFQSVDAAVQPVVKARLHFHCYVVSLPRILPAAELLGKSTRNFLVFLCAQHSHSLTELAAVVTN